MKRTTVLALVAAGGVAAIAATAWRASTRASRAASERLGPGAAVVRAGVRVAAIERRNAARGRGRLPLFLAPATGPVIDSARVGALAARLVPGTGRGPSPVIELVPRDAVTGLPLAGRLVVTPGEPGLLVFGSP
ncbi:MAG: hypothetical protein ACXWZS_09780 [Gemmatirosa sp.]